MLNCASTRGDCIALVDHPNYAEYSVSRVRDAIDALSTADNLTFAAAFTPWFKGSLDKYDTNGDVLLVECPASFGYLFAYARSIQSNPVWKATAGVFRGVIPELKDVNYVLTNADCEILQARASDGEVGLDDEGDNAGIAINPIAYRRYSGFAGGFNYVLNGNRTMRDNQGSTVATSFLNVRVLVSEISKTLYDASVTYTFEQNSDILFIKFKSLITPLLDKMQAGEGIQDYRIDRIQTNKKARLCARITIVPIEAVEDFELEIYLDNSIDSTIEVTE